MIYEDIRDFPKQFEWRLETVNAEKLGHFSRFVVAGMGGSNLAADLLRIARPDIDIAVHRDYGLPAWANKDTLVVLSSFSGDTEETLDAYRTAAEWKLPRFAIGAGGRLIAAAEKDGVPYIKFPEIRIQPRVAIGWSFLALLKAVGDEELLAEAANLTGKIDIAGLDRNGKELAGRFDGLMPVIYSSQHNRGLSYVWKINFNESAKIEAFANVLPEVNHNEISGFSGSGFFFLFLEDNGDHPRILKRFATTERLLGEKGFKLERIGLAGSSPLEKIFNSVIFSHFTAYYLATARGVEPEAVPLVEEFKRLIG
ncbi:MAG TPA: SIS domain-containing protein [Candidatus Paceibacterota bacterium]|nr:SIS domain-containing protein [Candidatus Paceibacterota bacterium]